MAQATNADLRKKLEEAERIIEAQKVELEVTQEKVKELTASGEGWLVETPSPTYEGRTLGVQFVRGQAFIRKGQTVEAGQIAPLKKDAIAKMGLTPEEIKSLREREKMTEAERAVKMLEGDFRYKVTYFDGTESADEQMEKVVTRRAKEYSAALEMLEAQKKAQDAVAPQFMGQSR